jgi:alpha-beta hydrolase superfamily lysophospholipase
LTGAGYRCVAFDHRAHGTSAGKRTSFGFHESRDVAAVAALVHDRWPAEPVAALGISMGAAAICFAARQVRPWDAIILESLYRDIASAFHTRIGTRFPAWFRKFSHGVVWVTEKRLHLRLEQLAPIDHIADLAPAPILLLTGAEDAHAPPEDAEQLFARCGEPREFWLVPGAGHRDVFEVGGEAYGQRVLDFLDRSLPAS